MFFLKHKYKDNSTQSENGRVGGEVADVKEAGNDNALINGSNIEGNGTGDGEVEGINVNEKKGIKNVKASLSNTGKSWFFIIFILSFV